MFVHELLDHLIRAVLEAQTWQIRRTARMWMSTVFHMIRRASSTQASIASSVQDVPYPTPAKKTATPTLRAEEALLRAAEPLVAAIAEAGQNCQELAILEEPKT